MGLKLLNALIRTHSMPSPALSPLKLAVSSFPCTDPSWEPLGTVNRAIINYVMQRGSKD